MKFPNKEAHKAKKVYLKITNDCNLNCTYCFQNKDKKSKKKISGILINIKI